MSAPQNTAPVYEVFTQTGPNAAVTHAGSVVCAQPQQAWHLAKEAFGRRDDLAQLWVVPRAEVVTSAEPYDPASPAPKERERYYFALGAGWYRWERAGIVDLFNRLGGPATPMNRSVWCAP